jgi:hypothetical protein
MKSKMIRDASIISGLATSDAWVLLVFPFDLDFGVFAGDDVREELDEEVTMSSSVGIEDVLMSQSDDLRRRICNVVAVLGKSFSTIFIKSLYGERQMLYGTNCDGPYHSFNQSC